MHDLSVSLLSFNTKDLLEKCLTSVFSNIKGLKAEVLLVDNNSQDNTVKMVRAKFPQVKLITNRTNKYYIKGHNQNLKRVKGKYFLILNEDTYLPKNTISKCLSYLRSNPKVGLVSVRQEDSDGKIDLTCSTLPHPIYEIFESSYLGKLIFNNLKIKKFNNMLGNYRYANWDRKSNKSVEVLPGSFIMGKSKLLKQIGLLDEKNLVFFYSEPDFCHRVLSLGFENHHLGQISIRHLKSKAFAQLPLFTRYKISHRDKLHYFRKYFGATWMLVMWLIYLPDWLYWFLRSRANRI